MNTHKNARLTPKGRALLVQRMLVEGLRPQEVAQAAGVSVRTVYKWRARYRQGGIEALNDRSSRPHSHPHQTPPALQQRVIALRRARRTYRQISLELGLSVSTIARILQRAGLNRLCALEPAKPVVRYVQDNPGDLLHLDIKKLGRFARPGHRVTGARTNRVKGRGWEYVHVAIDDHSRLGFGEIYANEQAPSASAFLLRAVRYYARFGITIRRVMTDNGACYQSRRFRRLCARLGIKHIRTKPYSPQTNGKAERFIQTALREWAYARSYQNSDQRAAHLPLWLHEYNWHRPHASLGYQPPVSSLGLPVNNLVGLHN